MFPFTALTARATFSSWAYDVKFNPRCSHSQRKISNLRLLCRLIELLSC